MEVRQVLTCRLTSSKASTYSDKPPTLHWFRIESACLCRLGMRARVDDDDGRCTKVSKWRNNKFYSWTPFASHYWKVSYHTWQQNCKTAPCQLWNFGNILAVNSFGHRLLCDFGLALFAESQHKLWLTAMGWKRRRELIHGHWKLLALEAVAVVAAAVAWGVGSQQMPNCEVTATTRRYLFMNCFAHTQHPRHIESPRRVVYNG